MKKVLAVLLGIVIGVAGLYAYLTFVPSKPKTPVVATLDFEGKIHEIGELSTAEYVYQITQVADKEKLTFAGIQIPFTGSKIIYGYSGTVKAGIDFNQITISADDEKKEIHIKLPEAKILTNELDQDSLVVYDERNSIFNRISFEDMNASQSELKKTAEQAAKDKGILDSAKENAKEVIGKMFDGMLEDSEYKIVFD